MKIHLWSVGKPHDLYVKEGVADFTRRISKYFPVEWTIIPAAKSSSTFANADLIRKEGKVILGALRKEDCLIALDQSGKQFSSPLLATMLQSKANASTKNLIFLIGGAFGLDNIVLQRAEIRWSLSSLTFPHQLVRLILVEQIYRACTIGRNEKYHHD